MAECSIDGCNRPHRAKGLCNSHYQQKRRGEPVRHLIPVGLDIADDECWCRDCKTVKGYSEFYSSTTKRERKTSVCKKCFVKRYGERRTKKSRPNWVEVADGEKWCASCETVKPVDDFHRRSNYCKPCHLESNRRSLYGLGQGEYDDLFRQQDGRCAICEEAKPLCVDHDHESGRVRGLLCKTCNSAIGLLGDNPKFLKNALTYLGE